mmetsp:Transcript_8665/g.16804  ORF Transcript_8665/g.16804 Transcript_8665/m.16804 type:complete len:205 (+) Transcript_8665:982-1596(+)
MPKLLPARMFSTVAPGMMNVCTHVPSSTCTVSMRTKCCSVYVDSVTASFWISPMVKNWGVMLPRMPGMVTSMPSRLRATTAPLITSRIAMCSRSRWSSASSIFLAFFFLLWSSRCSSSGSPPPPPPPPPESSSSLDPCLGAPLSWWVGVDAMASFRPGRDLSRARMGTTTSLSRSSTSIPLGPRALGRSPPGQGALGIFMNVML